MAFKGITFAGQNVTPKNDGGLYQAHYGDGILWGCSMAISGDDLVIQSGEFIMGGRVVQVDGATSVDLSGRTLQTGYIQVIMNADLSQGEGNQWYPTFVESATTTFPALTTDDINDTGTLYQIELAVIQISGGNLTNLTKTLGYSFLVSRNSLQINGVGNGIGLEINENGVREITMSHTPAGSYFISFAEDGESHKGGMFIGDTDGSDVVLYNNGSGSVVVRPNGASSTAGQFFVNSSGNVNFNGSSISNSYGGLNIQNGNAIYYADTGNILFRPNGSGATSGQVYIDTSGEINGGHPLKQDTRTTATSVSANTWVTVVGNTGLKTSGLYLLIASCSFASNYASGGLGMRFIAGDGTTFLTSDFPIISAATWRVSHYAIVTGSSNYQFQLNTGAAGRTGTSQAGATINAIRIG